MLTNDPYVKLLGKSVCFVLVTGFTVLVKVDTVTMTQIAGRDDEWQKVYVNKNEIEDYFIPGN